MRSDVKENRKLLRKQRVLVLNEINKLLYKCNCTSKLSDNKDCENCKKIRELSQQYAMLNNPREKELDMRGDSKIQLRIPVSQYLDYKKSGKSDKEIAAIHKVSPSCVSRYKKRNNIKKYQINN